MEEKIYSDLSFNKVIKRIKIFFKKFSKFGIFHKVETKWENSFSLRINYVLKKDKEKTHSVEIFIESNDVHSIITIKNEHHLVIQYFILEFQKIL